MTAEVNGEAAAQLNDEAQYRRELVSAEMKSQDDYDKTIVSLSGGAFGISLLFIKDIVGDGPLNNVWAIVLAWSAWSFSIAAIVTCYYFSRIAFRIALRQLDCRDWQDQPGGWCVPVVQGLNLASGVLFLIGIVFLITFASTNLG